MRGAAARLRTVVVVGLLGAATGGGACSGGSAPADDGTLRVALMVQDGYVVRSVHYDVDSSSGAVIKRGDVGLAGGAAGTVFQLELPPADGDTILVTATSTSGAALKATSKPFNVLPRRTTVVSVTLPGMSTDAGAPPGKIEVTGTILATTGAPVIAFLAVSPVDVAAGSLIEVSVTALESEVGDGLSYAWTAAPDGLFAAASSPSTTYGSSTPGTKVLTITVSDHQTPALTTSASVVVTISPIGSGVGVGGMSGTAIVPGAGGLAVTGSSSIGAAARSSRLTGSSRRRRDLPSPSNVETGNVLVPGYRVTRERGLRMSVLYKEQSYVTRDRS
jgi:hypothetical protein